MMRANRRRLDLVSLCVVCLGLIGPGGAASGAENKLPPERTFSNMPYLHRILLRDEDGNLITAPKAGAEDPGAKPMSQYTTCGKCHSDVDVMYQGWHSNASDPSVPKGRNGEPWLLTDVHTRTQIPLSYRKWPGTYRPDEIGMNDHQFALSFGRHLPGGDAAFKSNDLRFKMSGKLELDCLICHVSDAQYDVVERAAQIGADVQNFKWGPTVAAMLGRVQGDAAKLRDNWDPTDPEARPAPKTLYKPDQFDHKNQVLFNVSRQVPNERCYYCHTSIDSGRPEAPHVGAGATTATTAKVETGPGGGVADRQNLESRWRHDRDIHLAKGMQCVDCHRNGADHMITRGYEGEADVRKDPGVATLSCRGCHYGTEAQLGGRSAAPRPVHKGLPTLHFDKLSCTACHSGPWPGDDATLVQTSMAHKLGLPHHRHSDDAAPVIQEPVFLRVNARGEVTDEEGGGKITPHKMVYPAFWGRMNGNTITPMRPEDVKAAMKADATKILGKAEDPKEASPFEHLTKAQIAQGLEKIAGYTPPAPKAAAGSTQPTTQPAWATGEPVYVTGGKAYKRKGTEVEAFDHEAAKPYAWALAHDVRSAQQALGARGCTDCHAQGTPIFDSTVGLTSLVSGDDGKKVQHEIRGDSMGALTAFALTYPMRPALIATGYVCAGLLGLLLVAYGVRAVGAVSRRF